MATAVATAQQPAPRWRPRLPKRLPGLSGGMLASYRIFWPLCALLALASLILGYPHELRQQADGEAFYGAGLIYSRSDAHGIRLTPFSDEARRAGVADGDLVVRVDGRAAPADDHGLARLLAGPEGSRVALALVGEDGRSHDVELTRSSQYLRSAYAGTGLTFAGRRWIEFAVATLGGLLMIAAAALLFFRRRRDPVAALLAMAMVVNVTQPVTLGGVSFSLAAVITYRLSLLLFLSGLLIFPDGRFAVRWWPVNAAMIAIASAVGIAGHWNLGVSSDADYLTLLAMVAVVAALAYRYVKAPPGAARQQMKFAVLGFVGTVIFGVVAQLLTLAFGATTNEGIRAWLILLRNVSGALTGVVSAAGLLMALLRYRLYDADTVIGRSAAYGILTVGFIALFAGTEKLAEIIGATYFEHSIGVAAGAAGAAIAAAVVVPLHNRVHRWAERKFQKPLIRLREGLPDCVADLRESAPVDELVKAVMTRVELGVRSTREAVLLAGEGRLELAGVRGVSPEEIAEWRSTWSPAIDDELLDCERRDPLFPLRVRLCIESGPQPETVGWLLLGPRPDGSFFGKDEREALEHVAGPIARAIHIAQLREQREEESERRIGELEVAIQKLAAAIRGGSAGAPA